MGADRNNFSSGSKSKIKAIKNLTDPEQIKKY